MKPVARILALAAIASSLFAGAAVAAAPASFGACAACHSVDGSAGVGPSFKGVYGRKAGSAKGFAFSPAMRKSGLTWDDKSLDSFLTDPQKAIPGNVMPFPGVADGKQRAEIIEYLKTVK
ncbi:MAG TPA: c-type cytochrome [Burkholderiales bacterium]|nr:c-type cytochrome [Burkholderiales bacterium]